MWWIMEDVTNGPILVMIFFLTSEFAGTVKPDQVDKFSTILNFLKNFRDNLHCARRIPQNSKNRFAMC